MKLIKNKCINIIGTFKLVKRYLKNLQFIVNKSSFLLLTLFKTLLAYKLSFLNRSLLYVSMYNICDVDFMNRKKEQVKNKLIIHSLK